MNRLYLGQCSSGPADHVHEAGLQYGLWWNHCYVSGMDRDGNLYRLACMVETIAGIESSQRNSNRLIVRFQTTKGMQIASLLYLLY